MTASLDLRHRPIHFGQMHVLLGAATAFLLGGYVFASGWFNWISLFRAHGVLSIPCSLSIFVAPVALYVSVRRMTEVGAQAHLIFCALLAIAALGLIVLGLNLWLRNWAG